MSESVRFTAYACLLAQAIYFARAEAYDLRGPHWEALDAKTRALYITQAADILTANRPISPELPIRTAFVTVERQPAKVIATITPTEPWGGSHD